MVIGLTSLTAAASRNGGIHLQTTGEFSPNRIAEQEAFGLYFLHWAHSYGMI
jgi:hypothetical protein